jgi:hypothetical protein
MTLEQRFCIVCSKPLPPVANIDPRELYCSTVCCRKANHAELPPTAQGGHMASRTGT